MAGMSLVNGRGSLARAGGALGIAGAIIGLAIFLVACAGFDGVFVLSIIPLGMGAVGMLLTIVGGVRNPGSGELENTGLLASLFVNLMSLVGGLLLVAVWRGWTILPGTVTAT